MKELIFEATQEADCGYVTESLTKPIVTQGDYWAAVRGYFFDAPAVVPSHIRIYLVRDESFTLA